MKENGPWTIKSSEIKYQNPWITVREDQVTRPDGKDGIFGLVFAKHGVSVLPIDDEGNVHLVEEFAYGLGETSINTANGAVDDGETYLDAARRELKEELGIEAGEWIDLGLVNPFTSNILAPARLFLARKLTFTDTSHEGTESIKPLKIPLQQAAQMVLGNKITLGQSCVLILKVKAFLENEKKERENN